jgi:hypothetical protein
MSTDYSRGLLLAETASESAPDALRGRIEAALVHVSADGDLPGSYATLRTLVADLRRLPVQLSIDPHGLDDDFLIDIEQLVSDIDPERSIAIGPAPTGSLHLRIGLEHSKADVSGVPDGHGTRLRRAGHPFPRLRHRGTGLGAVLTGAMLTGEAFKIITGLRVGTYQRINTLDFCPVTLGSDIEEPKHLHFQCGALAGAGAIGTAVALILRELGATGGLIVVDRQIFEPPNVTTYSLGSVADAKAELPKVDIVKTALPAIDVETVHGTIDDLISRIDAGKLRLPNVVFGALDNIDARHDLQRIYADLTLDGGTGGRAGTTLSLHEAFPTGPCLRCYFPSNGFRLTAELRLHHATGLPLERIARGDEPITEDDLRELTPEGRRLLKPHLGKPVCGLGRLNGLTGATDEAYRPSAAFVAQQAACLMVGALIARNRTEAIPARQIEYDALFGPQADMVDERRPRPGCYCQGSADLIRQVQAHRYVNSSST